MRVLVFSPLFDDGKTFAIDHFSQLFLALFLARDPDVRIVFAVAGDERAANIEIEHQIHCFNFFKPECFRRLALLGPLRPPVQFRECTPQLGLSLFREGEFVQKLGSIQKGVLPVSRVDVAAITIAPRHCSNDETNGH